MRSLKSSSHRQTQRSTLEQISDSGVGTTLSSTSGSIQPVRSSNSCAFDSAIMLITLYGGWTDLVRPVAVGRAASFPHDHQDPPACRQSELVALTIWQITQARDLVKRAWLMSSKADGNDGKADDPIDLCWKLIWEALSSIPSPSRSLISR